jgi:predicted small secreted protein
MKKFIITAFVGLATLTLSAQKIIEKNFNYSGQSIDLEVKFASEIEVKTWDKSTVYFKAELNTKDGKYLDLYQLDIDKNNSSIDIESDAIPLFEAFQEEWDRNHPAQDIEGIWKMIRMNSITYFMFLKEPRSK